MWYVCVGDMMDVVFSVCIVRRGAVGARVWEACVVYECCVGFGSLGVVLHLLHNCTYNPGLDQLSDYCIYVYCVESFAHIE